jgi:hypothetical protein
LWELCWVRQIGGVVVAAVDGFEVRVRQSFKACVRSLLPWDVNF